jgi:putative FmdB family regulatory protein
MPIYEFRCEDCATSFETLVRAGHRGDARCPRCNGARLVREMSVFASRAGAGDSARAAADAIASNGGSGPGRMGGGGCCGGACGCH